MKTTSKIRVALVALYSAKYPSIGETHALSVLSGHLKNIYNDNVEIVMLDMASISQECFDPILDLVRNSKLDILGISVGYGTYTNLRNNYIRLLEVLDNSTTIVVGGPIPTTMYEQVLSDLEDVIVVIGEGENALKGIVDAVLNKFNNYENIPNIAYKQDGIINLNKQVLTNLKEIPPPDRTHVRDLVKNNCQIFCELSRGCSWSLCTFCLRGLTDNHGTSEEYRRFNSKRIVEDFLELENNGVRNITFADEDFLGNNLDLIEETISTLSEAQRELKEPMRFDISVMPSSLYKTHMKIHHKRKMDSILEGLKDIGLRKIFLGVESGSETQLKRYRKSHNSYEASTAISMLKHYEIEHEVGWIMFDPLCNMEEIKQNVIFIKDNDILDNISFIFAELRLHPKTKYIDAIDEYQIEKQTYCYKPEIDLDTLSYEYRYIDETVTIVIEEIRKWRKKVGYLHYLLKNISRYGDGSILGSNIGEVKDILWMIRSSLFENLSDMVADMDIKNIESKKYQQNITEVYYIALHKLQNIVDDLPSSKKEHAIFEQIRRLINCEC